MQHLQYTSKLQFILSFLQDNFVLHYELVEKRPALPSVAQNVRWKKKLVRLFPVTKFLFGVTSVLLPPFFLHAVLRLS